MLRLRATDCVAGVGPINREVVVRIGETSAGFARTRTLATVVVGIPGDIRDAAYFRTQGIECWIVELGEESALEFRLVEPGTGHALAGLRGVRHSMNVASPGPDRGLGFNEKGSTAFRGCPKRYPGG